MNNNFFKSNNYYLLDLIDGEIKRNKIIFSIINKSKYSLRNAVEVEIENKKKEYDSKTGEEYYTTSKYEAFIKSSTETYREDLDIINSEIAYLLDIPSSKVFRLENEEHQKGIANFGVKEDNEKQINLDELVNKLISYLKASKFSLTPWLNDYFSLPKTSSMDVIHNENEINSVIEMGINTIITILRLSPKQIEDLKNAYFRMIFFDLLTNNTYRAFNNYSVLITENATYSRLAPIYDYNNDLEVNNYYLLNNIYIEKNAILSLLYRKYYEYIKNISRGLTENYSLYLESINLIIENNTDKEYVNVIKDRFKSNLDTIKTLELVHSRSHNENKLDIAMTQTSINLNALNRNQLIQSKYNVKKKSEPIKVVDKDEVKVIVETQKKPSNVGKNIFLIILGIILVLGIGIGVAYLVINYLDI